MVIRRFSNKESKEDPLPPELIHQLITTAIELHDRAARRDEARQTMKKSVIRNED